MYSNNEIEFESDAKPVKSSFLLQFVKGIGLTILILGALAAIAGAVGLAVPAVALVTAGIFGMAGAGAGMASIVSFSTVVGGILTGSLGLNIYQAARIKSLKPKETEDDIFTDEENPHKKDWTSK